MKMKSIFFFIFCICVGVGYYQLKNEVIEREEQLTSLEESIRKEKETIHVLGAEWAYLTSPTKLKTLVERTLDLQTVKTSQIVSFSKLPDKKPVLEETERSEDNSGYINSSYTEQASDD